MAGAVETLTLDQFGRWAARLGERARRIDWTPAFKTVKVLLAAETQLNFARSRSPSGQAWKPLKHPSRRRGGRSAKPLRNRGLLMASMTAAGGAGHFEEMTRSSLSWGTNVPYAGFHQDGTRHVPRREFLGWSAALVRKTNQVCADHATNELLKMKAS